MPLYSVGKVIKEARKRLRSLEGDKYSQENVAEGICSVATLSKIENCVQNPSKKVMEALLQRLGLPVGIYNISATDDEIKRAEIEWKINACVAKRNLHIEELLEEYRSCCASEMGVLEKQFYLYFKAIYMAWGRKAPAEEEKTVPSVSALRYRCCGVFSVKRFRKAPAYVSNRRMDPRRTEKRAACSPCPGSALKAA